MPLTVDEVDAAATKLQSAHKGKSTRTGGALLEAAIKKDDLGAVTKLLKDGSKPTPQTLKLALTGCDDRAIAASIVPLSSSWGVDATRTRGAAFTRRSTPSRRHGSVRHRLLFRNGRLG